MKTRVSLAAIIAVIAAAGMTMTAAESEDNSKTQPQASQQSLDTNNAAKRIMHIEDAGSCPFSGNGGGGQCRSGQCPGSQSPAPAAGAGQGLGRGQGHGQGNGQGQGHGMGRGAGNGQGCNGHGCQNAQPAAVGQGPRVGQGQGNGQGKGHGMGRGAGNGQGCNGHGCQNTQPAAVGQGQGFGQQQRARHGQGQGQGQGQGFGSGRGLRQGQAPNNGRTADAVQQPTNNSTEQSFRDDHDDFFFLLEHRDSIRRNVKQLSDGIESLTESDDDEVAGVIQAHVAAMYDRLEIGSPVRMRDPLFREVFQHANKVNMQIERTAHGVRVIETSQDPYVAKLLQAHAQVVNLFLKNGFAEMPKNHAVPQ